MPRTRVIVPERLLAAATERAEQASKSLDALYVEAIERYIESTKHASAGAVRSRLMIPRSSPEVAIEIPDELFQRAEEAGARQDKRRHTFYADAVAYHLSRSEAARNPFVEGHEHHNAPSRQEPS